MLDQLSRQIGFNIKGILFSQNTTCSNPGFPFWVLGMLRCTEIVPCTACMTVGCNFVYLHHVIGQIEFSRGWKTEIISCLHILPLEREDGSQSVFPFIQFFLWNLSTGDKENCICFKWKELNWVCWFCYRWLFVSMQKPNATWEVKIIFFSSVVFLIMSFHQSSRAKVPFFSLLIISKTHKDKVF